jgi:hypothetical protein
MRPVLILAFVTAAVLATASPGAAQSAPGRGEDPARETATGSESGHGPGWSTAAWSFDLAAGSVRGGPANDLVDNARASGFDDEFCFLGCISYPKKGSNISRVKNLPSWVAVRHRLGKSSFHAGIGGGAMGLGEVDGHHIRTQPGPYPNWFSLKTDSKGTVLAAMAWWEIGPELSNWAARIGAGPSLNQATVRVEVGPGGPDARTFKKTSAGYVAEIGLTVPRTTKVYGTALVQYRRSGTVKVAGWASAFDGGASYTLESADARTSHTFIGFGVGGRF